MKLLNPSQRVALNLLSRPSLALHAGRISSGLGLRDALEVETAARRMLMYAVVPSWLAAGFIDYLYHRSTHIERTSGARESLTHALMLAEGGVPTLAGLFLDINAGVLATTLGALLAHEVTAIWDLVYATPRRYTSPGEQHVHGFLQVLPFTTAALLFILHPRQAVSLVGVGNERPRFGLRLKLPTLPMPYIGGLLAAMALFGALPYAEELLRCLRTRPTLQPQPIATPPGPQGVPAGVRPDGSAPELAAALLSAGSSGDGANRSAT